MCRALPWLDGYIAVALTWIHAALFLTMSELLTRLVAADDAILL